METLSMLLIVLHFGCVATCLMMALAGAMWLASYLAPIDPSSSRVAVFHEKHTDVKWKRRNLLHMIEDEILSADGCLTTRRTHVPSVAHMYADETDPALQRTSSAEVSGVRVIPTLCVGVAPAPTPSYTPTHVRPPSTLSDDVLRILARAHMGV